MNFLRYLIIFLIFFVMGYFSYMFSTVIPQSRSIKKNKNKKVPPEIQFLEGYYKVNIKKIGLIRTLRILNLVNALMFAVLIMIVFNVNPIWLKLVMLGVLMIPMIWVVYYFVAKYLKYLERKSENE